MILVFGYAILGKGCAVTAIVHSAPLPHAGWIPINWGPLSLGFGQVSRDRGERGTDPVGFRADSYSRRHA